ncbi:MAG: hypothetical protein QOI67_277 [Gaiellaceae bacterium]|jgi:hypothetical protein|nr:hypothetical protein [Gaiellaceae bacterium]
MSIARHQARGHDDRMGWRTLAAPLLVAALIWLAADAPSAAADDGGRIETRTRVSCTRGTTSTMRLRAEKGQIRIDLELEHRRQAGPWLVVVLHERQIVARVTLRSPGLGPLELRRTVPDWFGTDTIVIRATGPRGEMCRTVATV